MNTTIKSWVALLALLALSIGVAYIDLGIFKLPLILLIAMVQAVIVLLFFMHLRHGKSEIIVIIVAAYLWLGILIVGVLHDYLSRNWLP